MRPLLIGFFVCINIHLGYAQWTEQDSIWLKDVLAGKDSIKLNPEFQKAIQSGSFLNPEPGKPMGKPQLAALLQSMERFLPEGVVGAAALPDKILGLLPHGHTVGGAAALDDREIRLYPSSYLCRYIRLLL